MFNVCSNCGLYSVEKKVEAKNGGALDAVDAVAVCPYCGYAFSFRRLPLFVITGASGSGKTAVCLQLAGKLQECVVLESDILWSESYNTAETDYRAYRELWLRMAKNIGQSGRPVALLGSALPAQFEELAERRYFSAIYYLALVCDSAVLEERLQARPEWRKTSGADFIDAMQSFNLYLQENAERTHPRMDLLDTTHVTVEESAARTARWITSRI